MSKVIKERGYKMTIYGYARVSTKGQDLEVQIKALHNENVETIYQEKFTGVTVNPN